MDWLFIFGFSGIFLIVIVILFVFGRHGKASWYLFIISFLLSITFLLFPRPQSTFVSGVVEEVQTYRFFVKDGRARYAFDGEFSWLKVGDAVNVTFTPVKMEIPSNDSDFNEEHYLLGKGVGVKGEVLSLEVVGHRWSLKEWFLSLMENSGVQEASQYLLLGLKNDMLQDTIGTFQTLAVLHLFTISGTHLSLLKKISNQFFGFFFGKRTSGYLTLGLISIYAFILKGNLAAWRAYWMLLFQYVPCRRWNTLDRLGLTGVLMICANPYVIFNLSFVFAMSLYFALIVFKHDRFSSLFLFLFSLMIQAYFQYEVNPLGIIFSWILAPVVDILFPLFLFNVLFGLCIDGLCVFLWQTLENGLAFLSQFSFTIITGRPSVWLFLLYYAILLYWVYARAFCKHHRYYGIIFISVCILIYQAPLLRPYGEVTMIDVGQGDCFLVSLPYQRGNILIDTGGSLYTDLATKTIIPYLKSRGIRKLDAVFISHDDFDHCGALESLQKNFCVMRVYDHFDNLKIGGLDIYNLNHYEAVDNNDTSQVIFFELGGYRYLFTGDASTTIEKQIMQDHPELTCDVLKVSHHGSQTGTSADFLATLKPKIGLISVGQYNLYGHPHASIISRLKAYGIQTFLSSEDGMVHLYFMADRTWVKSAKK